MANDGYDPLADYDPAPASAFTGGSRYDPDAKYEGPAEYSDLPDSLVTPFDEAVLTAAGYTIVDPEQFGADAQVGDEYFPQEFAPASDLDEREYSGDTSFPVDVHGTYAENYPADAQRLDALPRRRQASSKRREVAGGLGDDELAGLADQVIDTIRNCLAAMVGRSGVEMTDMVRYILSSTAALNYLDEPKRKVYERLGEVFLSEYLEDAGRVVDLTDIPGIRATSSAVQAELELIVARAGSGTLPKTPTSEWKAIVGHLQRVLARQTALEMVAMIDGGATDEDVMGAFRSIAPPSASKSLVNSTFSNTAYAWEELDRAAAASSPGYRISSGYPTLDYAFTQKDKFGNDREPRGSWAPGELHIIAAPTGNGKSASARRLITSAAEDLCVGWGREHDKVLIAITEESPKIVYQVAGLAKGQPFHHLAKNVVIANIGSSRRRLIHAVWDCVVDAFHRAQETGMPIANCGMPSFIVVDYIGGIIEDGESADTSAIEKTANLLMRGVAAWDVQLMEEFSGESFAAYAGMSWPSGLENFQPAVLGFGQFRKLADPQWYDEKAKSVSLDDFRVPDANGEPGWDVMQGDFRIPTQGEVRGSGILINHATSLIILHRSRPQKNPTILDPQTGRIRLADSRARWLLVKTRNGSSLPFIEMRFDSIPSGLRGQFFDFRAEIAIRRGLLRPTACYLEDGDPIVPNRPARTPLDGVSY